MPNGKKETIAEIKRILGEMETRPQPVLAPGVEPEPSSTILNRLKRGIPTYLTSSIAREMGFEIEFPDKWLLKISPGRDGEEPEYMFRQPEGLEIYPEDIRLTPEGEWTSRQEVEIAQREAEAQFAKEQAEQLYEEQTWEDTGGLTLEEQSEMMARQALMEGVFKNVFPDQDITGEVISNTLEKMAEDEEYLYEILTYIQQIGRTADTENLLRVLFPTITEDDFQDIFFTPEDMLPPMEQALERFSETPLFAMPTTPAFWERGWEKGIPGPMDLLEWLAPTKLGAVAGVAGAGLEKYVGRPWEAVLMETAARLMNSIGQGDAWTKWVVDSADELREKYGWAGVFSPEVSYMWDRIKWQAEQQGLPSWALTTLEWVNPAYLIPIGGLFGLAAKFTGKVPLVGRGLKYTAAGVGATERALVYPVAKPLKIGLKYTAKGLEKAGVRLGEGMANKIIKQTEHLELLMELPASEDILKGVLVDNWMKRTLQIAAKIPPLRVGIERGLGWRIITKLEGQAVEDIVARGAVVHAEIARRGLNAKAPKIWELRGIEQNPVKLFGFDKNAYSSRMAERLLPKYAAEREFAGTLEHVFTRPEMYSWKGMERGMEYVTKVHEVNTEILNLLKKEGVPPKNLTEDWWIHRVVEGKFNPEGELIALRGRPGVRGARVGVTPSYEMHRKAPTMAEGIAWGVKYNKNPELAVGTYIEEAFKKIADERFMKYIEPFGVTPTVRLAQRYPELVERVLLTKTELADAAKFQSLINRAIRGEKLPEQTLRAMERRFPEMGKRLRSLIDGEPIKPIDEAAYLAEHGPKDFFGFPQGTPARAIGEAEWKAMTVSERVTWVKNLGMEGKTGFKSWQALTVEEKKLLSTGQAIKPKVEGVKGLEGELQIQRIKYEPPPIKSVTERSAGLESLRNEVKALTEARKAPYWQARSERAFRMEQIRQPEIGEGYLPQPFAGGRIFKQDFIDSFNKFFGHDAGMGVLKVTSDIAGILRITKAALDFSAMAIQGLPSFGLAHAYLMFNPVIGTKLMGAWYKAFFQSTRAFFDPSVVSGFMTKNRATSMNRIAMGGSAMTVDYFAALQVKTGIGGKAEWLMGKIPLKPYHRAETAFFAAGEMVRDEFWRILSPKAIARGQEFELARLLDRMTGIIDPKSLGVPLTVRQLEQSFVWFAPSYTRACLTVLSDVFRGGFTGAEARKALGGLIAAGSTFYTGVQFSLAKIEGKSDEEAWDIVKEGFGIVEDPITGEVSWKPTGRFMTIKIGNYNFGVGGFWYGLLRLSGNISACVNEVGEKEIVDLMRIMKNGSFNKRDNPFIYWWFSRSSPFFGSVFEMSTGRDFLGYPIETGDEYAKYIATRFEPIWMEQGLNWMIPGMARDSEVPEGVARTALVPAELFGLRTFPESDWVDFYDLANEFIKRIPEEELDEKQLEAWREGTLEWKHLTEMQKADLLRRYPELEESYGGAQADSAIRNSPHWKAYEGRMEEERQIYYDRIEQLTQQLLRGEIDSREYREKAGDAGQNYGSIMEAIARDPNYAEIYAFFDKKEAEGDKYGFRDDVALGEYQSNIIYAEDLVDDKGDYDWDERDRRVDAFIEKWGQDTYDRIQQYLQQEKGLKGLPEVWIRKGADTEKLGRSYWRLPYKPIIEMDDEDMAEGNIPAEYLSFWKQYQALDTDEKREAFIELRPEMAKDWRAEYRKDNPEADAMLALWGYGGRLQTREAYDLVTQWGRELGIPLEQMGLGLPPRSLIDQYFEYGDIVNTTSGNSAEARLFRMEHPEWESWAEENWGWKPPDDNIEVLRISVEFKGQDQEYDAILMDDESEQRAARLKYLEENPDYAIARRRREAYQDKFPEDQIDNFVEYYGLPEKGFWRERFLLEHQDFYKSMLEIREIEEIEPRKIMAQAYDEIYVKWQELFDKYASVKGTATERAEFRAKLFESNPEFHEAWLRRSAYGLFFPEEHIQNYVDYYSLERKGMEQELFLAEHPEFKAVASSILGWEPIKERHIESLRISVKYQDMDALYSSLGTRDERAELLENNPAYADARRRRDAYDYGFPDNLIDTYAEYYKVEKAGYEDDWFLMAHTEFYEACLQILEWEPRDFSKVPTRKVYMLYQTYLGLPKGTPRYDFRVKHPELDAWLVLKFDYKPIGERGEEEAEKTPWEEAEEARRLKEWMEEQIK